MIDKLIGHVARRQFARAMTFHEGAGPWLPTAKPGNSYLLYLHVPFCEKLCPYCSFNRVAFDDGLCRAYFRALRQELSLYKARGFRFDKLYVGGGTPTVLVEELTETLDWARHLYPIREISAETTPSHLTDRTLEALRRAGVNRLSVGIQSFGDGLLKAMNRYEKYGSGDSIAARLREIVGVFDTLNVDMIFNFANQTAGGLEADLDRLLETDVDQITYYPLMSSTKTQAQVRRTLGPIPHDRERQFYEIITRRLVPPYHFASAWCFSRKPSMIDEYIVDCDDYAGLGSGSIGYLHGTCYANTFSIRDYVDRINRGELPLMATRTFPMVDQVRYAFLMKLFGLRLDRTSLRRKYGRAVDAVVSQMLLPFSLVGAVRRDPRSACLQLTEQGRYYWVVMMREYFTAVNNFRDFGREQPGMVRA